MNPKRKKPYGTGHALLQVRDKIDRNFAVINADDYYGKEAFSAMAKALKLRPFDSYSFCTMSYYLENTISENGYVSRGECFIDSNGKLNGIIERPHIEKINGTIYRKDENLNKIKIDGKTIVSMNFWGFTPKCFDFGQELFLSFLKENYQDVKAEFFIALIINEIIKSGSASVEVLSSGAQWFGVTYKEDKDYVQKQIKALRDNNIYPEKLWGYA